MQSHIHQNKTLRYKQQSITGAGVNLSVNAIHYSIIIQIISHDKLHKMMRVSHANRLTCLYRISVCIICGVDTWFSVGYYELLVIIIIEMF